MLGKNEDVWSHMNLLHTFAGLEESCKTGYQYFPASPTMILRSGLQKPCEVKLRKSLRRYSKNKLKKSTASLKQRVQGAPSKCPKKNSLPAYKHRERKKCYLLTRDSKTVRFDLDEHGHCKISIKDSQSTEDIAWLDIFTSNKLKDGKNLVTMTQKSENNCLLLGKDRKELYLKVLNPHRKKSHHKVTGCMEVCTDGVPDPRQVTEQSQENQLFIMHYNQADSVKFQCYQDENYYLHVNNDSVDIRKMEETDADGGKDFYFKVTYL